MLPTSLSNFYIRVKIIVFFSMNDDILKKQKKSRKSKSFQSLPPTLKMKQKLPQRPLTGAGGLAKIAISMRPVHCMHMDKTGGFFLPTCFNPHSESKTAETKGL